MTSDASALIMAYTEYSSTPTERPITAICGWFALITRVAAIPSRAGINVRQHHCGFEFSDSQNAASPFDASPNDVNIGKRLQERSQRVSKSIAIIH
jgi:hypothetical protein